MIDQLLLPPPCAVRRRVPIELSGELWRNFERLRSLPFPFLLDSAAPAGSAPQFSYLGAAPRLTVTAHRVASAAGPQLARLTLQEHSGAGRARSLLGEPIAALRALLAAHRVPSDAAVEHAGLQAGAVGVFGYEARHFLEALPDDMPAGEVPEIALGFYDTVVIWDHQRECAWLSTIGRAEDYEAAARAADRAIDEWSARLAGPLLVSPPSAAGASVTTQIDEAGYTARIAHIQEAIFAGRVFEACLTHRIEVESPAPIEPWALYQRLRALNPAPYASVVQWPEFALVSASPELFLRLDADGWAESRPVKGTRPRGRSASADAEQLAELQGSEKDRAEHDMIVDVVRNDLGKLCRYGSVEVPEHRSAEQHPHVHQLVSTIRGQLAPGHDALDLWAACFPGGSMTGAPKIEAMKLLAQLEPVPRGLYSGAIGYLDYAGPAELAMVIRSVSVLGHRAQLGVGGAIVADSEPAAEYEETQVKARATLAALAAVKLTSTAPKPCR